MNEQTTIRQIAYRAEKLYYKLTGQKLDTLATIKAITDVHSCYNLRLKALLATDDGNFGHDVFGIIKNIDPETRALRNCFEPRYTTY